jgi:F-type H+-transporting ATPase subunit b
MDEVLRSLGGLLIQAIPTLLLIVALYFYLKRIYFKPMARVLSERYDATEGARKQAEDSLAKASLKAGEYEAALRAARADIYREQEEFRKGLQKDHARAVADARQRAELMVKEAGASLAAEADNARRTLALRTEALADRIAETVLHGRAA